jgi:hypothetical protein
MFFEDTSPTQNHCLCFFSLLWHFDSVPDLGLPLRGYAITPHSVGLLSVLPRESSASICILFKWNAQFIADAIHLIVLPAVGGPCKLRPHLCVSSTILHFTVHSIEQNCRFAMSLKADSHIACRAHPVPLPCRATKGLERVFPIWFTQCGRVWFIKMWSVKDRKSVV